MKDVHPLIALSSRRLFLASLAFCAASYPAAHAGTWSGAGSPELGWVLGGGSPYANWADSINPAGTAVIFDNAAKTTQGVVGNRVTASLSVNSLRYMNLGETAADWVTTEINTGTTLTIANGLTVGGYSTGNSPTGYTRVAIVGGGTLNLTWGTFGVGNNGTDPAVSEFDLSGLSRFVTAGAAINVGNGRANTGILKLAEENELTTATLTLGSSAGNNAASTRVSLMELGRTNTIKADTIFVGASDYASATNGNRQSGELRFRDFESGPTAEVVIRGRYSTQVTPTAANLYIGKVANDATVNAVTQSVSGSVDFSGGRVDALLGTVVLGDGKNTAGTTTGSLTMDEGTIVAGSVTVGHSSTASTTAAGFATGNLNIDGGTFQATSLKLAHNSTSAGQKVQGNLNITGGSVAVTNGIVMGHREGTAEELVANITVSGGLLDVGGNIARVGTESQVTATLTLSGGTLDMKGFDVVVDHLLLQSGTLRSLGQANLGAVVTKSTTGTLVVEGDNTYTGRTEVAAGALLLTGTLSATDSLHVANGATLGGSGAVHAGAVVNVGSGGTLALENAGLGLGTLELEAGAAMAVTLASTVDYGRLQTSVGVSLDGADLQLTLGFAVEAGDTFTLISNSGSDLLGQFASVNGVALRGDQTFTLEFASVNYTFQLLYNPAGFGSGSDLVLTAVPEPGSLLWLGAGAAALVARLRKRRSTH